MQPQITLVLILVLGTCVWAETKVESNAENLQAEESSINVLADKHQEKRYVPYSSVGNGYYGSNVDPYYNSYSSRGLGYDGGYSNLGYGAGYGTAGYGGVGYGGYGGVGYGGYGSGYSGYSGYGGYNPYYRLGTGYSGYRPSYNSYPSSYYSGGYGSSIVGGTLGSLGGAAGIIQPVVPGVGYPGVGY